MFTFVGTFILLYRVAENGIHGINLVLRGQSGQVRSLLST